tara:strand:+ start:324 stop:1301 length:978 start_codon:yes stop_codon:yes gene_type:complete
MKNFEFPTVSIVIAMRNEEQYISQCLDGLFNQSYPLNKYKIFVVDGDSEDNSVSILKAYQIKYDNLFVLNNPKKINPAALNIGIKASKDEIIGLFGAHSIPSHKYIESGVRTLIETNADCVGGGMNAISNSKVGEAISYATSTPFGIGGSVFHYAKKAQFVTTVYQGFFNKKIFDRVGYFNEIYKRNSDDEMSYRIRKNGGKIYFNPKIKSKYYNRSSFIKLFKQYYLYGLYKPLVFINLKYGLRFHHTIPLLFTLYLFILPLTSVIYKIPLLIYFILCLKFSLQNKYDLLTKLYMLLVFPTLHISYGLGSILGIPKALKSIFFK